MLTKTLILPCRISNPTPLSKSLLPLFLSVLLLCHSSLPRILYHCILSPPSLLCQAFAFVLCATLCLRSSCRGCFPHRSLASRLVHLHLLCFVCCHNLCMSLGVRFVRRRFGSCSFAE
ncbi:hypothetical protein VIGAN_05210100, partial [Vigna angularis var. angularis]